MICPQCGKHYSGNEEVCLLCAVPLQSFQSSVPASGADVVRPPGIDQTLETIRQDIDSLEQQPVRPAGFFIRLLAYGIDSMILGLLTLVLTVFAYVILERGGTPVSSNPEDLMSWFWLLFILPNTALTCLYFIYFHAVTGQTVGKLVCGLHVVTVSGCRSLGWGRSIIRCGGYFLSSLMYLGFVWILFNSKKRGWHDYLAGSMVVYGPINKGD